MKPTIGLALTQNLKELNLSTILHHLKECIRQARENGMDYDEFLLGLTKIELKARAENRFKRLLKEAKFPRIKTFETFDCEAAPEIDISLIPELADGKCLWQHRNIILYGDSGTGKTHLAIALGIEACKQGIPTRFVTGFGLVSELIEAKDRRVLNRVLRYYSRHKLMILDDLRFVPFSEEGRELLYQVLAERCERGFLITTTNLDLADCEQVIGESNLATVILDRMTREAHIISCGSQNYRLKENQKASKLH